MNPTVIDLQPFRFRSGNLHSQYFRIPKEKLQDALTQTNVLNLPGPYEFILGKDREYVQVDLEFLQGYFYELVKKIGYEQAQNDIKFRGSAGYHPANDVYSYINKALRRKALEKKKKERELIGAIWGTPCQLMIPDIGTIIKLSEPWKFRLQVESRNWKLLQELQLVKGDDCWTANVRGKIFEIEIPGGSILKVDRIYIRKGGDDYRDLSSITFILEKGSNVIHEGNTITIKKSGRFWAKLSDVNDIVCRVDKTTLAQN